MSADSKMRDRDQLKDCEARVSVLRSDRADARKEMEAAQDAYSKIPDLKPGSKEFDEAQAAVAKLGRVEDALADAEAEQVAVLRRLSGASPQNSGLAGPGAPPFPESHAWQSGTLLADDGARQRLSEMATASQMPVGRVNLGYIADRDALASMMAADVTGSTNMRRGDYIGVLPQLRRQLRILDLLPIGTMDQNTVPYTQESGSFATAVETAEGGLKPEAAVTFTDEVATAATIAHWTVARKQALADFAALQTILDGRLRYGVERRLQDQILAGDGLGENIRGILNTTGVGTVAYAAGELVADQILRGLTQVLLADGEASAIVLHPTDWMNALMVKAVGDGHYYSSGPFAVTPQVMWGVPLIPSSAIPVGTALVGDFAVGVQLFIREGVILLISDSDQDDFIRNRVKLLAEMRAALAVWRPTVFTTVDLAA